MTHRKPGSELQGQVVGGLQKLQVRKCVRLGWGVHTMRLVEGLCVIPAEIVLAKVTQGLQDNEGKRKTPVLARPKLCHNRAFCKESKETSFPGSPEHFWMGAGPGLPCSPQGQSTGRTFRHHTGIEAVLCSRHSIGDYTHCLAIWG